MSAPTPSEGLSVDDCRAILAQATDPELDYRIAGWILRAMADELLACKAGQLSRRRRRALHPRPLFDETQR